MKNEQRKLSENIEGLGDILVFLTENKRNSEITANLNELSNLLTMLFNLRQANPNKFDHLMLDDEYWKMVKKDKHEAAFRLNFIPEKYLVTFSLLLNQLIRVFETSIKNNNDEITREACYQLIFFLAKASEQEKAEILVKEILKKLLQFSRKSLEIKSSAMYASTYDWYSDIVFNNVGQSKGFRYDEYLELFNSYFFENLKYLISEGHDDVFKNLIGHLIDGIHVPTYSINNLWDITDLLRSQNPSLHRQVNDENRLTKQISDLVDESNILYSSELFTEWQEKLKKIRELVYPHLSSTNKRKLNKIISDINSAIVKCYANQRLINILFVSGAWSIYKNQYRFIKEIWTHKQPDDATASYSGNDIYPEDLKTTVELYFHMPSSHTFFWDDHHDSGKYTSLYFLVLIIKYLRSSRPYVNTGLEQSANESYPDIDTFELPFTDAQKLADIKFEVEGLINVANTIKGTDLLMELDLAENKEETDSLVDKKLIPFLNRLKENASDKLQQHKVSQPLSTKKILEFKEEVIYGFNKSADLRSLLKKVNMFENKIDEKVPVPNIQFLGYNKLERRDMFFENWHVTYADWGKNFGKEIGEEENIRILKKITQALPRTENADISILINDFEINDNTIIIASHSYIYDFLERTNDFKPYWTEDIDLDKEPRLQGYLVKGDRKVKIYDYHLPENEMFYSIMDISTVGTLTQHFPLEDTNTEDDLYDIFTIRIRDLSLDNSAIADLLAKPPSWLSAVGDEIKQRKYIEESIILQIGEKFEFTVNSAPQGIFYSQQDPNQ